MVEVNYFDKKAVSHSDLKLIDVSINRFLNKKKLQSSPTMDFGTRFHEYYLERDNFKKHNLIKDIDLRTKKDKEFLQNADKNVIKKSDFKKLYEMKKALLNLPSNPIKFDVVHDVELEIEFNCYDLQCRSKLDYVNHTDNYFVDIKTIADITKAERSARWDYLTQIAFYQIALYKTIGIHYDAYLLFVENQEPYDCVTIAVTNQELIDEAKKWIKSNMDKYKYYLKGNQSVNYFCGGYIEL